MTSIRTVVLVLASALAATIAHPGPLPTAGDGSLTARSAPMKDEPELLHPLALGVISETRTRVSEQDVRANRAAEPGDLAACHIQNETTIAVDGERVYVGFNDTSRCVLTLGLADVNSSITGFARSTDGGATFQDLGPVEPNGPVVSLVGDPVLAVDTTGENAGTLYLASLANNERTDPFDESPPHSSIAVGVSTDHGQTFTWRDAAAAVSAAGATQDKEWIAVDNSGGPGDGNVYLVWTEFAAEVRILFSRSLDQGATWSVPIELDSGSVSGARPVVGPDGEVHVAWVRGRRALQPKIMVATSMDQGSTFAPAVEAMRVSPMGGEGCISTPTLQGGIRVESFPAIAVDTFGSPDPSVPDHNPHRGTVYVVAGGGGKIGGDEADVFLARLAPGQTDWSGPVRLNDDLTTNDQFMPEVVATGPGRVAITWTDRREDPANDLMRQWWMTGENGGATLTENRPFSETLFPAPQTLPNSEPGVATCYAGDYNALTSDGESVFAAWGDNRDDLLVTAFQDPVIPDPNVYVRTESLERKE